MVWLGAFRAGLTFPRVVVKDRVLIAWTVFTILSVAVILLEGWALGAPCIFTVKVHLLIGAGSAFLSQLIVPLMPLALVLAWVLLREVLKLPDIAFQINKSESKPDEKADEECPIEIF